MKSLKKNFIYNFILTFVNMIFPLITAPYLSKILGAENLGKVNLSTVVASWFILVSAFGIPLYGIREVARNRDDKNLLSKTFWNLFIIQFALSVISLVLYLFMININQSFIIEKQLYIVTSLMLILNVFTIDWFYQGIEEFGFITIRSIVVKVISICLIFITITSKEDYVFYALINILGLCFNNVLNFINVFKYINKKIYRLETLKYLNELKTYFYISLVVALCTRLDQTVIGYLSTKDLALYMRSKMLLGVGLSLTNSFVGILSPRTAYLIKSDFKKYINMLNQTIKYIYIIAIPCVVGLFLLSSELMLILGGKEFLNASISLKIISPLILIISIGNWQGGQIILANKKESDSFKIMVKGMLISVVLNTLLIGKLSYIGASITWLIVEFLIVIMKNSFINKNLENIKVKYINKSFFNCSFSAVIMGIFLTIMNLSFNTNFFVLIVKVLIASFMYFVVLILLKESLIIDNIKSLKILIKKKVKL